MVRAGSNLTISNIEAKDKLRFTTFILRFVLHLSNQEEIATYSSKAACGLFVSYFVIVCNRELYSVVYDMDTIANCALKRTLITRFKTISLN